MVAVPRTGRVMLLATAPFYALGGPADAEEHFRHPSPGADTPLFAYDIPVCVHTKLPWKMLARLGAEGVLQALRTLVMTCSQVSLSREREERSVLSLFTPVTIVVDGAFFFCATVPFLVFARWS